MSRHFRGCVLGLSLLVATATTARANLLSYEPFGYQNIGGDLQGSSGSGSFGFATSWVPGGFNAGISNNYDIAAGSLSFGALLTSGKQARRDAVRAVRADVVRR